MTTWKIHVVDITSLQYKIHKYDLEIVHTRTAYVLESTNTILPCIVELP
jgi:hypothetical protein